MEKLELDYTVQNGRLIVDLPEEFHEQAIHVVISKSNQVETDDRKWSEIPVEERMKILNRYKGTAKYPDFPIDKYDVYDQ